LSLHAEIVAAYAWAPQIAWRLKLSEAIRLLRARQRWAATWAQATAALIAQPFLSDAARQRIAEAMRALLADDERPPSLAEQYGDKIAEEVAALEARQEQWLAQRKAPKNL